MFGARSQDASYITVSIQAAQFNPKAGPPKNQKPAYSPLRYLHGKNMRAGFTHRPSRTTSPVIFNRDCRSVRAVRRLADFVPEGVGTTWWFHAPSSRLDTIARRDKARCGRELPVDRIAWIS